MSSKETSLKEKFRIALTSTARVISDNIDLNSTNSQNKKAKDLISVEIDNLTNPSDFIRLRAETDSSALKKKFSNDSLYRKNLPSNSAIPKIIIGQAPCKSQIHYLEFLL